MLISRLLLFHTGIQSRGSDCKVSFSLHPKYFPKIPIAPQIKSTSCWRCFRVRAQLPAISQFIRSCSVSFRPMDFQLPLKISRRTKRHETCRGGKRQKTYQINYSWSSMGDCRYATNCFPISAQLDCALVNVVLKLLLPQHMGIMNSERGYTAFMWIDKQGHTSGLV